MTIVRGWRHRSGVDANLSDCSLVIPTFGRPTELMRLLNALAELDAVPHEVVVVDGASDRATGGAVLEWSRGRSLRFDVVWMQAPPGLTRQRNVGLDASQGRYVFFLDDDCVPLDGYFTTLRAVLEDPAHADVGAVCGSIVNAMGQALSSRWRARLALRIVPRIRPGVYYPSGTSAPTSLQPAFTGCIRTDIVPGGATAYRRAVFEQDRFSEFFAGYGQGEDLEMSLRIGRGWRLLWSGDAHVLHLHASGGRPGGYAKGRMDVRNRYFIWRRHTPAPATVYRVRFWADMMFIAGWDLLTFLRHPLRRGSLAHALGVASGALSCLVRPPVHREDVARRYSIVMGDPPSGLAPRMAPSSGAGSGRLC